MRGTGYVTVSSLSLAILGLLASCGGSNDAGPGTTTDCTSVCTVVAARCADNAGAISSCPAACQAMGAAGTGALACAAAATSCDSAQACVSTSSGHDGGINLPADFILGANDVASTSHPDAVSNEPTFDPDAFFAADPPPMFCPLNGMSMMPMLPGGTPDCPDDKNRQGCPCPTQGMTAACWPGLRVNRNLGMCKDGMTTCMAKDAEGGSLGWGPCMGYVLPAPGATAGAAACECFSKGTWSLANVSPCFIGSTDMSGGAISTVVGADGKAACPMDVTTAPSSPWTTDTVNVDCAGNFNLCFTLKAGDGAHPMPTDCTITQICTMATDYPTANMTQAFPPLASWLADSPAAQQCAQQFTDTGGYGEMSVTGTTVDCTMLDKVFNRVTYCPLACNMPNPPAMCSSCRQDGSGQF